MEENNGCTFADIVKMVRKRIWWVLGIAVLVTAAAVLLTVFVFGRGKDVYRVAFAIEYPGNGIAADGSMSYPDGTQLRYETLVYAQALEEIKASDEAFAGLDTASMSAARDGITISERTVVVNSQTQETQHTGIYEISVGSRFFENEGQASAFLHAVAEQVVNNVNAKLQAIDLSAWETKFERAENYSGRLSALRSQYEGLLARYDALLSTDAYASFRWEGQTLGALRNALEAALGTRLASLETELDSHRYILSETDRADTLAKIAALEAERERNTQRLDALTEKLEELYAIYGSGMTGSQLDTFESFHDDIRGLTDRNAEIDYEIALLYGALGYTEQDGAWVAGEMPESGEFEQRVEQARQELSVQTQTCKEALSALYGANSAVNFEQSGIVVEEGGGSALFAGIAAFLIAFIVLSAAVCLIDYPAYRRARSAAQQEVSAKQDA